MAIAGKRMTRKKRRLILIGSIGSVLALSAALVLTALQDQIVFFQLPSDVIAKSIGPGERIRLGGLIETGSIVRGEGETVSFGVKDETHTITVFYTGILPDLFREEQGVVTEGMMQADGTFSADTVLAKHDENYMPKEVADALKEQGVWKGGSVSVKTGEGSNDY
jgi:cytochrome c-type biogenesis protein CcmE